MKSLLKSLIALGMLFCAAHFLSVDNVFSEEPTAGKSFHIDASGISREVLENYLDRSVTMAELLAGEPFGPGGYPAKDDDLRLIENIGAKFIGRSVYRWGREDFLTDPEYLGSAKKFAARIHKLDSEIVLQACLFEIVTQRVNNVPIPAWVFETFNLPPEERNFSYERMLSPNGKFVNHWNGTSSVPDITQQETQLWFIFLAGTYFDIGCEALHLGQTALIGMNDPKLEHWNAFCLKLRDFAKEKTRRGWVLLDAHTPTGGMVYEGRSILDFNSFPLRIKEIPDTPLEGILEVGYLDSLFLRSHGGVTPSGWKCDSVPFLVEFDNFGVSRTAGQATLNTHFIWGYDEITWLYQLDEERRNNWLKYAADWIRKTDPNAHLQMPVSRMISLGRGGSGERSFRANNRSDALPNGLNLETTIKELFEKFK